MKFLAHSCTYLRKFLALKTAVRRCRDRIWLSILSHPQSDCVSDPNSAPPCVSCRNKKPSELSKLNFFYYLDQAMCAWAKFRRISFRN